MNFCFFPSLKYVRLAARAGSVRLMRGDWKDAKRKEGEPQPLRAGCAGELPSIIRSWIKRVSEERLRVHVRSTSFASFPRELHSSRRNEWHRRAEKAPSASAADRSRSPRVARVHERRYALHENSISPGGAPRVFPENEWISWNSISAECPLFAQREL